MHLGYLVSRYPAVSHTFVQREVAGLRALGIEVDTFSVRAGTALSDVDRTELAATPVLVPPSATDLVGLAAVVVRHPGAAWRLAREAVASSTGGARATLWQAFYAVEGLLLWRHLRRRGITHVHAHFANVASDVARLATRFTELTGGEATWSFTMHGPTEFADVKAFGLAGKVTDAELVVCISDFCRSQLMALVDEEHWAKLAVVHCGIDPTRFAPVERVRPDDAPLDGADHLDLDPSVGCRRAGAQPGAEHPLHEADGVGPHEGAHLGGVPVRADVLAHGGPCRLEVEALGPLDRPVGELGLHHPVDPERALPRRGAGDEIPDRAACGEAEGVHRAAALAAVARHVVELDLSGLDHRPLAGLACPRSGRNP